MIKKILFILSIFFFALNFTKAQWVQTNLPDIGLEFIYSFAVKGNKIFAGTGSNGVYLTTDNGFNWIAANTGLPSVQITSLISKGNNIFAGTSYGTSGYGVFLSTNDGVNWIPVNNGLTNNSVLSLAVNGDNIFAGTFWGGIFISSNNGSDWQSISNGLPPHTMVFSFAFSGTNIFAGTSNGVYISTNNGSSWILSGSLPGSNYIRSLIIVENTIFAGSGDGNGIFLSNDDGLNWNQFNSGLMENFSVWSFANSGNYIFVCGQNPWGGGVFFSPNNNIHWTTTEFNNFTPYALTINENFIFVGSGAWVWRRPLSEIIPNNVSLLSPGNSSQNGYTINTLTPAFLWSSVPSATNYELQLYKKINNNYELHYINNNITNNLFYLPTGFITNNTQYYWRVRASVNNNWTLYSTPYYFNVNISSITPTIYTSSAIIQTGEQLTFSGNHFTANNQAKAVISSNTGYDTSITVATNNFGALIHSLPFTIPGTYSIYCKDILSGNSSNQRSFEVRSTTSNVFNITGPPNSYQTNTSENILVNWKDKLETGTNYPQVNNQRGYKYIVETSSNGGGSWFFADSLSGFDDINKTRTFSKAIVIPTAGSYLIRVKDWYVSNRTTGNVSIQVTSATVSDLVVGFEWDYSYSTNTGKPLGVVSDGTSRFYIKVSDPGNTITQATFSLSDDNSNTETRILGKVMGASNITSYSTEANNANQLSDQGVQHSNNTFWCWYVAPDDFLAPITPNNADSRDVEVTLTASYSSGPPKVTTRKIKIQRPPLILVHGLNGNNINTWHAFSGSSALEKFDIYKLKIHPRESYDYNSKLILIPTFTNYNPLGSLPGAINDYRNNNKIACNQVYYVGHSMGGAVLRYAETNYPANFNNQRTYLKGYINKFITLSTPHRGSPFANLLEFSIPIVSTISLFDFGYLFNDYYVRNSSGFITDINNAVKDLKMNSQNFISTSFKSHVIVGDIIEGPNEFNNIPQNQILELNINPKMYNLFRTLYYLNPSFYSVMNLTDLFYKLFTGSNSLANSDLIVPLNSQLSNLNLGDALTTYTVNFHSESTGSPSIEVNSANKVNILLDKSYSDIVWGSLPNIQQNFSHKKTYQMNNIRVDTTGIEILSPSLNDTLYIDSLFNIVFSLSDTTQLQGITITYQDKFITDTIPQFNYNFSLSISNNMLDTQRVFVMAHYLINDSVFLAYKSVPVIIKTHDIPSELKSDEKFVYLLASEDYYLDMNLYFNNYISKIGTRGTNINVTLGDPTIFTYDNINKKLTANTDGDTYAIIEYNNLFDTIYFKVRGEDIIPVELSSFTAIQDKENVTLNWVTQTELNNLGFEIERKNSTNDFINIGFVEGNGTSTISNFYTFVDKPEQSDKLFYRLKQIDFDGTYSYSQIIEIDFNSTPIEFALFQNYPNPFNPMTTIKYSVPKTVLVKMNIYDILGREIIVLINEVKTPGNYEVDFNASNLSSGVYFYRIQAGDFLSTKKMLLVK